jgi:Flp pilus assembly protein TadD
VARTAYVETFATRFEWGWSPLFGVRSDRYKFIRAPRPELYDLHADPGELRNLAAGSPDVVRELERDLDERVAGRAAADPTHAVEADERARLEALGYLMPPAGPAADQAAAPLGTVGGTDPKDGLDVVEAFHRMNTLVGMRQFDEALAVADTLGDRAGVVLRFLELRAALGAGEHERAKRLVARLLDEAPTDSETHAALGLLAERDGDAAGARAAYERALALEGPSAAPLTGLGRLAEAAGRLEEGRSYYERARRSLVFDAEPSWRLAALELEAGQVERGSALLLGIPPEALRDEAAALRVAAAELAAGRVELARLRLDAASGKRARSPSWLALRGRVAEALGNLGAARRAREAWLAAAPGDPAAQADLARTLAALRVQLPRARALAEEAVARSSRAPGALDALAAVLVAQDDPAQALARVDEALPGAESEARQRLLYRRAEALAGLGRRSEAEAALADARAESGMRALLAPEDARVSALLARPRTAGAPPRGTP